MAAAAVLAVVEAVFVSAASELNRNSSNDAVFVPNRICAGEPIV